MANFSARMIADRRLQQNFATLKKLFPEYTRDALNEHAINVQARAKQFITSGPPGGLTGPAVDTGRLRASIKIEVFSNGYARRVGSDLRYAPFIEFGTSPHFPPLEPIREWCRRHGIPESAAYPIALKIARHGTPERPFLYPAHEMERRSFEPRIIAALRKVGAKIA